MIAAAVLATYAACRRPNWFLAVLAGAPALLVVVIPLFGGNVDTLSMGPMGLRTSDPGAIAILIGIMYHGRSHAVRSLRRHPGGTVLGIIAIFLTAKVLATVMMAGNAIASNGLSNTLGGGLVAALGEIRDDLLAIIAPVFAVVAGRHLRLSRMTVPFVVAIGIILSQAAFHIVDHGQIWSGTGDNRFIGASEAVTLTLLSLVIFFIPAAKPRRRLIRSIACFAFAVAILSDNRSQWLASLCGIGVLSALIIAGKLMLWKDRRSGPLYVLSVVIVVVSGAALVAATDVLPVAFETTGTSTRMKALTDPGSDATSVWRMQLWRARIEQTSDSWAWGRVLGDRPLTLINGTWLSAPNHNAYVTAFELGGVFLLGLVIALWGALVLEGFRRTRTAGPAASSWAPAVALAVIAASLAFGTAYDFPMIGPMLATTLLLRTSGTSCVIRRLVACPAQTVNVGGGEKGYQNGGEVVPCQGSRSE